MKEKILQLVKEKWENFYNENAARNPKEVEKYQSLIDWVKTATVDDLEVTEKQMHMKTATYQCRLAGRHHFEGTVEEMRSNFEIKAYMVDDQKFADAMGRANGFGFSIHTNDKVLPDTKDLEGRMFAWGAYGMYPDIYGCRNSIAKAVYEERFPDYIYDGEKAQVLDRNFGEPQQLTYYDCELKYKNEEKLMPINFGVVNGQIEWFNNPEDVKAKTKKAQKKISIVQVLLGLMFWPYGLYLLFKMMK